MPRADQLRLTPRPGGRGEDEEPGRGDSAGGAVLGGRRAAACCSAACAPTAASAAAAAATVPVRAACTSAAAVRCGRPLHLPGVAALPPSPHEDAPPGHMVLLVPALLPALLLPLLLRQDDEGWTEATAP